MRYGMALLLVVTLWAHHVWADDGKEAEALLRSKLDAALLVLQKPDVSQDAKIEEISNLVTPIFDFELMAKLTLGKKYWPGLSPAERDEFTDVFVTFLKASYLDKIMMYTDEEIVYGAPVQKKNKVYIATELVAKENKISMIYKFYRSKDGLKIYDIEIQGVSLIVTYRSQFDSILQKGSFKDLLLELKNKNPTPSSDEAAAEQST